jgi:F-type H+-transporting ATPase subunit b
VPQLDPTWFASQIFWLFVFFTALYMVLSRKVLPPLQNVMNLRKDAIDSDLAAAQDFKEKAEQAEKSYKDALASSREKAQALLSQAESAAKEEAEKATKLVDSQVSAQIDDATAAINDKKQQLLGGLMPSTFELSALIIEKLTNRVPDAGQLKHAISLASSSKTQG